MGGEVVREPNPTPDPSPLAGRGEERADWLSLLFAQSRSPNKANVLPFSVSY